MKLIKITAILLCICMALASCVQSSPDDTTATDSGDSGTVDTSGTADTSDTESTGDSSVDTDTTEAEAFDYMANDLSGMVKVANYVAFTVTRLSEELTEDEFQSDIENFLSNYSYYEEYTDRAVAEGDTVIADYSGALDGVAFSGGTATNQEITAAANTGYIEGFAEAFIGQMPDVEFSFNVTFPEDYGNETLNGQEVTFTCTIHYIRSAEAIVPELTDEFVTSNFEEYSNVEEFEADMREKSKGFKIYYVDNQMYSDLWQQILDGSEVISYPEGEVERLYNDYSVTYQYYAAMYGVDYDTFLAYYVGTTDEELRNTCELYVTEDLIMYTLIKEHNISLTEEEYSDKIAYLASYYGTTAEEMIDYYGTESLRTAVLWETLMSVLVTQVNISQQ